MWTIISQFLQSSAPCLLCRTPGSTTTGFCEPCLQDLPLTGRSCLSCGMPEREDTVCGCSPADWPFAAVLCACHYDFPADRMIHQFKEAPRHELALPMARLLAARVRRHPGKRPSLLIPVPAADNRLRRRGFDQSLELARAVGGLLKLPVRHDAFRRQDGLPAQKGLDKRQREDNIRRAFSPAKLSGLPAHVALVDDVLTTGATVRHLAALLQDAGVRDIDVWTFARTL